jgi:hypothetical protein
MEEYNMKTVRAIVLGATVLLLGLAAWAQEFPRVEVAADYSFVRFNPAQSYTNGHSLNGGGGAIKINLTPFIGVLMDLQGYGSNTSRFVIPPTTLFPGGASANIQGNMFTYLFGPQIKARSKKLQPFGQLLFGGAHSNVYGNAFTAICQPIVGGCSFSKAPSGNAFAMAVGGGVDIPISHAISFRPVEIDYLLTRFTNQFNNNNQNNFRYSAGVVFSFGGTQ